MFDAKRKEIKEGIERLTQNPLTRKQYEVLYLMSWGFNTKQIAAATERKPESIGFHRRGAYRKIGFDNLAMITRLIQEGNVEAIIKD